MLNKLCTALKSVLFTCGLHCALVGSIHDPSQVQAQGKEQPEVQNLKPGALARLPSVINEASGLCHSTLKLGYYWTHNDSLDQARLFFINERGQLQSEIALASSKQKQITHRQAYKQAHKQSGSVLSEKDYSISNVDWEGCTSTQEDRYDGQRIVYVADTGNNFQWRQDLKIYVLQESIKTKARTQTVDQSLTHLVWPGLDYLKHYSIRFPNSKRPHLDYWSEEGRCRDVEAIFWRQHQLFLISKCIIAGPARLWRVPREQSQLQSISHQQQSESLTLEALEKLPIAASQHPLLERVTDASYTEKANLLAVLTYQSIWFFKVSGSAKKPLFKPFAHCELNQTPRLVHQAEAISWHKLHDSRAELLVLTESRAVYRYILDFNQRDCIHD